MKKKHFVLASSLLALLLGSVSCSSEGEVLPGGSGTASGSPEAIRIVVHTPAPDDIIMSRAVQGEEAEYAVKKLGVYLFLAQTDGSTDGDYTLAYRSDADNEWEGFIDGGSGSLSCSLSIQADWLDKTAKVALIANDSVSATSAQIGTTLAAFKQSLATAQLKEDGYSADSISGNICVTDGSPVTGLPMTAMAKSNDSEAFKITPMGASLSASLQRIMARVDVCNLTPNLTITGLSVTHAAAQAYLFPQESQAAPAEIYYTLQPTAAYNTLLGEGNPGIGYITPGAPDADLEAKKQANIRKQVFYLYEQVNGEGATAEINIDYELKINEAVTKVGKVSVPLKTTDDYINTTRNNLYTIVIGDGTDIGDGILAHQLIVNDWEETTMIPGDLEPGTDNEYIPDAIAGIVKEPTAAAIGDYYMADGTLRDAAICPPEAYPHVIGIVFQTAQERIGQAEKDALGGTTHGLVMAVKLTNDGYTSQWKPSYWEKDDLAYIADLQAAYGDINGLGNYNTIKKQNASFDSHPAFKAIEEFEKKVPAPKTSTGWFLPSIGQLWDMVSNLGNMMEYMSKQQKSTAPYHKWYYNSTTSETTTESSIGDVGEYFVANNLNTYLNKLEEVGAADLFSESSKTCYWSSSAYYDVSIWYMGFTNAYFYIDGESKNINHYVRAILAF